MHHGAPDEGETRAGILQSLASPEMLLVARMFLPEWPSLPRVRFTQSCQTACALAVLWEPMLCLWTPAVRA